MENTRRRVRKQLAHIRSIDPGRLVPPDERFRHDVTTLGAGSVFRLGGRTFLVLETGMYRETDDAFRKTLDWTGHEVKAVCLETGVFHYLEWEADDGIAVSLTTAEVRYADLRYDDGEPLARDSDDLDEIAEKGWEVVCRGRTYDYEDDFAARYVRGGGGGENVYFYAFEACDGEQLTIEVWTSRDGRETFQAFLSQRVAPDDIEVVAVAGTP